MDWLRSVLLRGVLCVRMQAGFGVALYQILE
jgi:hypothetical protein